VSSGESLPAYCRQSTVPRKPPCEAENQRRPTELDRMAGQCYYDMCDTGNPYWTARIVHQTRDSTGLSLAKRLSRVPSRDVGCRIAALRHSEYLNGSLDTLDSSLSDIAPAEVRRVRSTASGHELEHIRTLTQYSTWLVFEILQAPSPIDVTPERVRTSESRPVPTLSCTSYNPMVLFPASRYGAAAAASPEPSCFPSAASKP